jgi:hypothetical protein
MTHPNQHRADWIAALRSGDFDQGQGAMVVVIEDDLLDDDIDHDAFDDNGERREYCCLGVACMLANVPLDYADGGGLGVPASEFSEERWTSFDFMGDTVALEYLPDWLAETLNLTDHQQKVLAALNDGGAPFEHIAAVLELEGQHFANVLATPESARHWLASRPGQL